MERGDLTSIGGKATEDAISNFEEKAGVSLPTDYRDFLLATSGGQPEQSTVPVCGINGGTTDLQLFFTLGVYPESYDLEAALEMFRSYRDAPTLVPIATDSGGNYFCLDTANGGVIYENDFKLSKQELDCALVAPSFNEFLHMVEPFDVREEKAGEHSLPMLKR